MLLHRRLLHGRCAVVPIVVLVVVLWWAIVSGVTSTCTGHDCFVQPADATAQGVVTCGMVDVELTWFRAGGTGMEVVDVASMRVAIIHVLEPFEWSRDQ